MIFALSGLAVLAVLLFQFWFSESGWFAVRNLEANVDAQKRQTAALAQRNRVLAAEVMMMKEGNGIVESRARTDLGMVAEGETFYVVVDPRVEQTPPGAIGPSEVRRGWTGSGAKR